MTEHSTDDRGLQTETPAEISDQAWPSGRALGDGVQCAEFVESTCVKDAASCFTGTAPLTVLVDNCARGQHALTHETVRVDFKADCPQPFGSTVPISIRATKKNAHPDTDWLISIAAFSRRGHLICLESHALFLERTYQKSGRYDRGHDVLDYHVFNHIRFRTIDSCPKPRRPGPWRTFKLKSFEGWNEVDPYGLYPHGQRQLRRLLKRARRSSRYREIEKALQGKADQDAWHIFQAERLGLDYFLTVDGNILEKARQRRGPFGDLSTTIVSPSQLGRALGLLPVSGAKRDLWDWAIKESALSDPYRASSRHKGL